MRAITGMMWISALLYSPKFLVATLSPEREIVPRDPRKHKGRQIARLCPVVHIVLLEG